MRAVGASCAITLSAGLALDAAAASSAKAAAGRCCRTRRCAPTSLLTSWGDQGGNSFADQCADDPGVCLGDINGDGLVDVGDLLEVIGNWGACGAS